MGGDDEVVPTPTTIVGRIDLRLDRYKTCPYYGRLTVQPRELSFTGREFDEKMEMMRRKKV